MVTSITAAVQSFVLFAVLVVFALFEASLGMHHRRALLLSARARVGTLVAVPSLGGGTALRCLLVPFALLQRGIAHDRTRGSVEMVSLLLLPLAPPTGR